MTLIITVEARNHIVATADGRSKGMIESNKLQKIFPFPNKGFAIAHHGQNLIDGRSIRDLTNEFFAKNAAKIGRSSIQSIAQFFDQQYGQVIRKTLNSIPSKQVCGLLFLGFTFTTKKPKICEDFWETGKAVVSIEKRLDLVLSGEANKFIKKYKDVPKEKEFRRRKILKGSVKEARAYCDKLYKLAEETQTKASEDIFGGHKHQLVIKKNCCEWLIPPT